MAQDHTKEIDVSPGNLIRLIESEQTSTRERNEAFTRLIQEIGNGDSEAARHLTRALQRGLVHRFLTRWSIPIGEKKLAPFLDVSKYHKVCLLLYRYWMRKKAWNRALICISTAIFCAHFDGSIDRPHRDIDRGHYAEICFELGRFDQAIGLLNDMLDRSDALLLCPQTSLQRDELTLCPQTQLHLRILKCKAFVGAEHLDAAKTYFAIARAYATAKNLRLPDWRPEDSDGDRISSVDLVAPGQPCQVAI